MIGSWWKQRRRNRILSESFPEEWQGILQSNIHQVPTLSNTEFKELQSRTQILVHEKNWEGCGGLEMTDEVKVTVAGQVGLMTLAMEPQYFDHVLSVLVYPSGYVARSEQPAADGTIMEVGEARLGEAWWRGPVILSWSDVLEGGLSPNDGRNLVFHEFAHQLDMLNGRVVDGMPPLTAVERQRSWSQVFEMAYRRFLQQCRMGRPVLLDPYAGTNRGEFFAVACETFFQYPNDFRRLLPDVFEQLTGYFQIDPGQWNAVSAA